jgi:hypothetical protein
LRSSDGRNGLALPLLLRADAEVGKARSVRMPRSGKPDPCGDPYEGVGAVHCRQEVHPATEARLPSCRPHDDHILMGRRLSMRRRRDAEKMEAQLLLSISFMS